MKSNKKLLAIITLAAFMMMLVPFAAFAGTANVFDPANRFATVVSANKTSVAADGTSVIKFTVYVYDEDNEAPSVDGSGAQNIYVASSRGNTDTFTDDAGAALVALGAGTSQAYVYTCTSDANGKAIFKVKSSVVGAAEIGVGLTAAAANTDVYSYLVGNSLATTDTCGFVKKTAVTFTAPSIDAVVVGGTAVADDASGVGAGPGTAAGTAWVSGTTNGNGIDNYKLTFKVQAASLAPVAGQEVTFTASNSAVYLTKTSATTDAAGLVDVKVSATKPGTYSVKATAGDKSVSQFVTFAANNAYDVFLISDNNQKVAKDSDFKLKFQLKDLNGNQVDFAGAATNVAAAITANGGNINIKAVTRPTDAAMDEDIDISGTAADYTLGATTEGYMELKIFAKELDTEGAYAIKVYLNNGKAVTVNFTVAKQGTVTGLTIKYDQTSVPINTAVGAPTVKRVDAAGVTKELSGATVATDIVFSNSDVNKFTAGTFITTTGAFTTVNDTKYAGTVVITAVDKVKNLTATATINVAEKANGFTLTAPAENTLVSTDAVVAAQFVDVKGNAVSISDATAIAYDFYVISKPSGAIVSTSQPATRLTDLQKYGTANLKVQSNVAGDVNVQVVATVTGGSSAGTYTSNVALTFGAPKAVVGAKAVTMFIGATGFVQDGTAKVTDVAPFIKDGRTFVAVRPLGDAFGAAIGWDEATQTVTLTRDDMTLTIVIGSNTITKVADGVTSTVTADVPAFIQDGRTVLPFRAVGEAFGAAVSYDAATQAVSFLQ